MAVCEGSRIGQVGLSEGDGNLRLSVSSKRCSEAARFDQELLYGVVPQDDSLTTPPNIHIVVLNLQFFISDGSSYKNATNSSMI
ncbi:hypothetical protein M413DRAFT_275994 [Hebeloma cylindrosporum]|uniref:Uncharacterized protein n=1 Tax=Hebeloma cylindrosporum TaxID=76867 RepID=A0A0C3BKL4_HEBCY|nr:hypothetical protein M413DRAFT_275994 [Hebeloma cylindrosporum h7]